MILLILGVVVFGARMAHAENALCDVQMEKFLMDLEQGVPWAVKSKIKTLIILYNRS